MNKGLRAALLALPFFSSCALAPALGPGRGPAPAARTEIPPLSPVEPARVENVILVTIDGVRWQEIFTGMDPERADAADLPRGELRTARGLTPNLHRLFFDGGTVLGDPRLGEPFVASGPHYVSLPSYVELMTGAVSGCTGNDCQPDVPWTIAAEITHLGASSRSAVFSSWSTIARAVPSGERIVREIGRRPGDEEPPYPGHGDYRPDRATAAAAIDHLIHHRPRMLWVALGDTDEWAHRGDYRGYIESLRFADSFLGELDAHLAEMGSYGQRTTVLVTADHGRDADFTDHGGPDSAAVWVMARGGAIAAAGSKALARRRYLRDIAPTIASLYGLSRRRCDACGDVIEELLSP
jgi:hypothetical protein